MGMKVLMTADAVGGVWTYALDLGRWLAQRDVHVTLATMGPRPSDAQLEDARSAGVDVVSHDAKLEWMDEPWEDVQRAGDWLRELESRLAPDVVHVNGYAHAALGFRAPTLLVAHSCVLSWWRAVLGEDAPERYARYREEVTQGLRAARAVVAPTRAMLSDVRAHYGLGASERPLACVIPNGATPRTAPSEDKRRFVLSAGRLWDRAKNIEALAAIAPRLTWPVFVAGDAHHPDGHGSFDAAGLYPLGRLDRPTLGRWMQQASIYALPARYEPFGLSALEAALAGCALVLGDIPSLREVWGEDAMFVHPDDHERLLATLRELCDDDERRAEMAARAHKRALRFSLERTGLAYLVLYRVLTRARSPLPAPACDDFSVGDGAAASGLRAIA